MSGINSSPLDAARAATDEPLSLTVHSMPRPSTDDAQGRRLLRGRLKLLLIGLCCAAPVLASYFTFYVIRPAGKSGYGQLIDPRAMPELRASTPDGAPVRLRTLEGQWLLVVVADAACNAQCEQRLYLQRQLRESLGREKERVERVWLVSDAAPVPARLATALEGATVLRVAATDLAAWLAPAPGHALADHLYLVDPMGNWMMRFPAGMDLAGGARAKRDLDRLLRASASWDQPGR